MIPFLWLKMRLISTHLAPVGKVFGLRTEISPAVEISLFYFSYGTVDEVHKVNDFKGSFLSR
jgi:hypothetical protein